MAPTNASSVAGQSDAKAAPSPRPLDTPNHDVRAELARDAVLQALDRAHVSLVVEAFRSNLHPHLGGSTPRLAAAEDAERWMQRISGLGRTGAPDCDARRGCRTRIDVLVDAFSVHTAAWCRRARACCSADASDSACALRANNVSAR